MEQRIIDIEYGSDIPVKIKVPESQKTNDIKKSIIKFKKTELYRNGEWSDDDLLQHLDSDGIKYEYVDAYSNETIYIHKL